MASKATRSHAEIKRWAKQRGACPSVVSRTGGMLRFEFSPASGLSQIDWDDFFRVFDERGLELVFDDKPGSRFHKFVYPETPEANVGRVRTSRADAAGRVRPARTGPRKHAA